MTQWTDRKYQSHGSLFNTQVISELEAVPVLLLSCLPCHGPAVTTSLSQLRAQEEPVEVERGLQRASVACALLIIAVL